MHKKMWLVIGAGIILISGYPIIEAWMNDSPIPYFHLPFLIGGLSLFLAHWFDFKKKANLNKN